MRPTKEQIAFAKIMSERQTQVLLTLANSGPFFLSATERGDPELYALIRAKLAQSAVERIGSAELFTWDATAQGKAIASRYVSA